jgi:4-azaleucine resistance transporter AzlC
MPAISSFRRGLRDGLVLTIPILAFGAVFGVVVVQAGFSSWLAVLSSVVILSGSAQFAMAGLLPAGPGAVLVSAAGLALRHVPMSASLSRAIGSQPWWRRMWLAWVLVDESYGLTMRAWGQGETDPARYKTAVDIVLYSSWVSSTALGAFLGTRLDPERYGLEVLFPLMFLGLAAPLVRNRRDWITAGLAVVTTVIAVALLPPAWRVTGAALVASMIGSRLRE